MVARVGIGLTVAYPLNTDSLRILRKPKNAMYTLLYTGSAAKSFLWYTKLHDETSKN